MQIKSNKLVCFGLVLFMIMTTGIGSADSLNVEQVGHINGSDRSIAIAGDYAYIGQNYDFVVVDIANPAEPIEIGRIVTPGLVEDIVLKGNYAYLANLGNGLAIVDITDPSSLQILGNNSLSIAWHIAIKENYAYLATPESGLVIVDVTNPFSPQLKNTFNSNIYGGEVTNIAVEGNYAYAVVAYGGDLFIVDITDLSSLTLSGTYTAGEIRDVAVNGNYAYVTDIEKGLSILDISDSSNPTLLGMYNNSDTNASTKEVVIAGNYAYVADYARGLLIVDIADPSSPELAGSYYIKKTFDVAVEGNYAYVVSPVDGLTILRVDNTSITTSHTPSYDNRLRESTPTTVLPSSNYIDIGKLSTTSYRDVMMFDLSDYKPTDTISEATLSLYWYYPTSATRTSDTVVEVYRPVEWDPKYVSWKNSASGKSWTTAGGNWFDKNDIAQGSTPYASVTFPAGTVPDNKYYEFDVTQLVQDYVSGKYKNTGLFIKAKTESGNYIAFYSSEWSNSAQRPKLSITSTSGSVDNPPVANAGEDTTATTGSAVNFDGSASTDDKGIASYSWDFDDSDGITSEATGPTATKIYAAAGTYTVTLTVTDTGGQESTDTLQVVVKDPATSVTYTPLYDNRLRESTPSTVLSTSTYIDIGKSTSRSRDVMMFDLNDYKTTDKISKATLSLYWYYPTDSTRSSDTVVEVYRPVEWDPKYVSWKYRTSGTLWNAAGGDWYDKNGTAQGTAPYDSVTFPAGAVPDNKYYEFDVTEFVQEYISGEYENTGFFLKANTESGNYIAFYSSDWANADQKPKLTITP